MKTTVIAAALWVTGAASANAMEAAMDAGTLAHELDRLASTVRVLYVAAHPDDENTRLLAHLANERHATVAYLSLTRGGGGQNLIGPEQGELLGMLRTEELLAARRLDGAQQRFTRAIDFGFSKSADESLAVWGREEILADTVWTIRSFRPDVILTRFDENPPNHGHHTASAILAREAFTAAADPQRFAEQLDRGVEPWQATRLMHNLSTWRPVVIPENALAVDVGGYDPRLGLSYGELAAISRSQHKSQGFGRAGERGTILEHLVPLAGQAATDDLFDGIDTTWARYGEGAEPLVAALATARSSLARDRPEAALPALLEVRAALDSLPDDPRVVDARHAADALMLRSIGLFARANAASPVAAPGASVKVELELVVRRPAEVRLVAATFPGAEREELDRPLRTEETFRQASSVSIPYDAPVGAPFWLRRDPHPGRYAVDEATEVDLPRETPPLAVNVDLGLGERVLLLRVPVVHAWTDRVHGERERRFLVAPPLTVTPLRDAVLSVNGAPTTLALRVRANRAVDNAILEVQAGRGWTTTPASQELSFGKAGEERVVEVTLTPGIDAGATQVRPVLRVDDREWTWREDVIDYPHVPLQQVFRPAHVHAATVDLASTDGIVGYVEGSGDTLVDDLSHVGVRIERIDDATLLAGDLQGYRVIVVGIRAYNVRDALRRAHSRLVEYAERGGTVIVQYMTSTEWDPLPGPVGPYPLQIGRGRVTDEGAAMRPVAAAEPLLAAPNRIAAGDFDGWVQERGLYFAETWDERWRPVLALRDPGENEQQGALLVAEVGSGRWVYTGLAFFRQLPAGVPGAYRLFANLLEAGGDGN
jgi:LmbE family N-acetylglucosaminyl deacetylase